MHTRYLQHALLIIGICAAQSSYAECPDGKAAVTVVTPSGISKDICVAQEAIPGLENAPDHAATELGPTCPCADLWTGNYQEGDQLNGTPPTLPRSLEGYQCGLAGCDSNYGPDVSAGVPTWYGGINGTVFSMLGQGCYSYTWDCAAIATPEGGAVGYASRTVTVPWGTDEDALRDACRSLLENRGLDCN